MPSYYLRFNINENQTKYFKDKFKISLDKTEETIGVCLNIYIYWNQYSKKYTLTIHFLDTSTSIAIDFIEKHYKFLNDKKFKLIFEEQGPEPINKGTWSKDKIKIIKDLANKDD
jgi:hypothetical protein